MSERQQDGLRDRAAAHVEADFKAQRDAQEKDHTREADRLTNVRRQEIRSFDSNRAEAERQHQRALAALNENERKALQDLGNRQRGLGGRVAGLVRPGQQEQQRQAVADNYEKQRLEKHIGLQALQERQDRARIQATQRHDMNVKTMQEQHQKERGDLAQRQDANRDRLTEERTASMKQAAEQKLQQEMQRLQERGQEQQQDRSQTIRR
jgi:hypothetical protein